MGKMNALSMINDQIVELTEGFYQCSEAEQERRRALYHEIQPELLALLGEDAPAHSVDPWMADVYTDLYKDRYNIRPRGHTYATMKSFMDNIPPLEDFNDEDEGEGDRFDPDISQWADDETTEDQLMRVRDFEEVYGVSAMGQAMRFMDMGDY